MQRPGVVRSAWCDRKLAQPGIGREGGRREGEGWFNYFEMTVKVADGDER